jgi:hypothetical protein
MRKDATMLDASKIARAALTGMLALSLAALSGCPDDPYDADTWIDKLDDKTELERALTELARLKDPKSIGPLGEAWRDNNYPARILRVIIDVADQFNPEKDEFKNISSAAARRVDPDDPKFKPTETETKDPKQREEIAKARYEAEKKRVYGPFADNGPYWGKAVPYLKQAVELFLEDDNNDRLIENAIASVDALGRAKEFGFDEDPEVVETIIRAATVKVPADSKAQVVRIAALRALGKWPNNPRAADTLIKVLNADPEDQHVLVFAAAADALGYAQSVDAIDPLIRAMFELPVVYPFCRRSLVAIGKPAIKPLMDVFSHKHKKMEAFAKEHNFYTKCRGDKKVRGQVIRNADLGGSKTCKAPKALEVKSANILGDLLAKQAIPMMLDELDEDPQASGYHPQTGAEFTNQHQAIFIALRKMGANDKVAAKLLAYAQDTKKEDDLAAMAIDTYSFVTRETTALNWLDGVMTASTDRAGKKQSGGDDTDIVALASSIAYSRLANERKHLKPFKEQIAKHKKAADSWEKKFEKANKEYEKKRPKWEEYDEKYKEEVVRPAIKTWEEANKDLKKKDKDEYDKKRKAQPWFEVIKKGKHKGRYAEHKKKKKEFEEIELANNNAENKMNEARGLQRAAEQNMARILVGIECKGDPKCLIGFAEKSADVIAKALNKDIEGADKWDPDAKKLLRVAAVERALLEIAKLGPKARPVADKMINDLLPQTERIIREGVLLALPHVVELPCTKCVAKLDEVIKDQENQTTLSALTADARVWRNFYRWAGVK